MRITLSIVAVFGLLVWTPGSALAKQKAAKTEAGTSAGRNAPQCLRLLP